MRSAASDDSDVLLMLAGIESGLMLRRQVQVHQFSAPQRLRFTVPDTGRASTAVTAALATLGFLVGSLASIAL